MNNYPKPHSTAIPLEAMKAPAEIVGLEIPYTGLQFPYYVSVKFNGVRGCLLNETWYSRNMKPLNIHPTLQHILHPIVNYANHFNLVFDGEFHSYADNTVGGMMSILAGTKKIPYDFRFKIFGIYTYKQWNGGERILFKDMLHNEHWGYLSSNYPSPYMELVIQELVTDMEHLEEIVNNVQNNPNVEGLMLASPRLLCSHRRIKAIERKFLKLKFYSDPIDAEIVDITARMEHKSGFESETNHLGYKERSRKQEDLVETDIAGALQARLEDGSLVYIPFPKGTSLQMRSLYFRNFRKGGSFDLYGRWVQFRKLNAGEKDKPVAIKCVEFRDSK